MAMDFNRMLGYVSRGPSTADMVMTLLGGLGGGAVRQMERQQDMAREDKRLADEMAQRSAARDEASRRWDAEQADREAARAQDQANADRTFRANFGWDESTRSALPGSDAPALETPDIGSVLAGQYRPSGGKMMGDYKLDKSPGFQLSRVHHNGLQDDRLDLTRSLNETRAALNLAQAEGALARARNTDAKTSGTLPGSGRGNSGIGKYSAMDVQSMYGRLVTAMAAKGEGAPPDFDTFRSNLSQYITQYPELTPKDTKASFVTDEELDRRANAYADGLMKLGATGLFDTKAKKMYASKGDAVQSYRSNYLTSGVDLLGGEKAKGSPGGGSKPSAANFDGGGGARPSLDSFGGGGPSAAPTQSIQQSIIGALARQGDAAEKKKEADLAAAPSLFRLGTPPQRLF